MVQKQKKFMITVLKSQTILKMRQQTIRHLRQTGYKVRVLHTRNFKDVQKIEGIHQELVPKGGYTKIEVTTPDNTITVTGESFCSNEELFDRKKGNSIALGRALKQLA